jgi:hypothetical protein
MHGHEAPANGVREPLPYSSSVDLTAVWDRVAELVDRAPSVQSLMAHRLHLVAARVWHSRGLAVPADLQVEARRAAMIAVAAGPLLERARAAYGGKLMLMKGPEAAARYRDPGDRFFCDLDLLADDASAAQHGLLKAGFVQCGNPVAYDQAQHLCPLTWPGIPLFIELHRRPSSPTWLPRPTADEILNRAVPSATGVDGLLAPAPSVHALLLLAHSWAEAPLGRLADLIDVAAVLPRDGRAGAAELARDWGWEGMWRIALGAVDAVLGDNRGPASLSVWARHLTRARDRSVLENHIARVAAPAWALPVSRAHVAIASAIKVTATRRDDELWADKLRRSGLAVAHAFMPKSRHEQTLSSRPRG